MEKLNNLLDGVKGGWNKLTSKKDNHGYHCNSSFPIHSFNCQA